ncbi:MAG TPA: hypothetical protein VHV29_08220 [Terriglobales bacterium]|jgi:hypothetical protein|nr:hypothetical protein [Terriglobales bacterium]
MAESKRGFWIVVAAIAIGALVILAIKHHNDAMEVPWSILAPSRQVEVATRMAELREEGQFGEAIDLGLRSTTGHSGDDFIYQMVAITYYARAFHDKDQSGEWTKLGAEYSQKAFNSNPKDVANAFNVGVNYLIAGDDLDTGGCEYYRRAQAIFENLVPRLQGDRAETQGRTVQLAPFRKRNEEELSRVKERLRHCQGSAK